MTLVCGLDLGLLQAQTPYLKGSAMVGQILRHSTDIVFENEAPAYGADIGLYWQTNGKKPWQQLQNFPRLHLSFTYHSLGTQDLVGSAIGITSGIELNLFRKTNSALHFGFGTGLAYLTRPFDRISNPENNAIGGNWNNSVTLKLDYERHFLDKVTLHFGLGLAHYSNGARTLPNLGLNIPNLYIAVSPLRADYKKELIHSPNLTTHAKRKWGLAASVQYTRVEIRVPGGPDYPTYVAALDAIYYPNANNRLSLGYQYDYNTSIAEFGLHTGDFQDQRSARLGATRHSLNIGNEFLFGHWAIQLKAGLYISNDQSFLLPRPFYFQLSPRYYFNYQSEGLKLYTGIHLKSHLFVAEYISWGVGFVF